MQELNADFASISISPKPSGTPMGKVPVQVVKEFECQARQNLCTLNFSAAFNQVISECNLVLESCRDSLKATSKWVKTQIQKGANPERAAKNGYERTCNYLDILDRINIQQKALACQNKALSHMLQRELYTMGNSVLIRREGEMSHLQPHLGDTRRQQLRTSPFAPSPLSFPTSKGRRGVSPQKRHPPKNTQGFKPYQNQPFRGPLHDKKRGSYKKRPYGGQSTSSNQSLSSNRGNSNYRGGKGRFQPHRRGRGRGNPSPPNDYSTSTNPPVGGRLSLFRRDWLKEKSSNKVLNIVTNGYVLPFRTKPKLARFPLILSGYKAHPKDLALASCIQSLLNKNTIIIEKVENTKYLGFYSRQFLVPKPNQKWRPVIDLSRLITFLVIEKFKMVTPESIRASLIPGDWVSSIDLLDAYHHIPIHPASRKYLRFSHRSQLYQFTSLPFGLATAPETFTMIVKEVKLMALSGGIRVHQYLDD